MINICCVTRNFEVAIGHLRTWNFMNVIITASVWMVIYRGGLFFCSRCCRLARPFVMICSSGWAKKKVLSKKDLSKEKKIAIFRFQSIHHWQIAIEHKAVIAFSKKVWNICFFVIIIIIIEQLALRYAMATSNQGQIFSW